MKLNNNIKKFTTILLTILSVIITNIGIMPTAVGASEVLAEVKNNGYPYGCNMNTSQITLVVEATDVMTYQWQSSEESNGNYSDIDGQTEASYTFTPVEGMWYRCKINDNLYTKPLKAIQAKSDAAINFLRVEADQWYLSNDTMAYSVWNTSTFDIVGKYVKEGTTYWMNTSYNRRWSIGSNSEATPAADNDYSNENLKTLKLYFNDTGDRVVNVSAELGEGFHSVAMGTDTMLGDSNITDYADTASLKAIMNQNKLSQVQMVGAESLDQAVETDPAFVFKPITPESYFWIGNYGQAGIGSANTYNLGNEGYNSNYEFTQVNEQSVVTEIKAADSAMAVTWNNIPDNSTVEFQFNIGSVKDTGAVVPIKSTTTSVTVEGATPDNYYGLYEKTTGELVGPWTNTISSEGTVVFNNLKPNTEYVVKIISAADYNAEAPEQDVTKISNKNISTAVNPLEPEEGQNPTDKPVIVQTKDSITITKLNNNYTYGLQDAEGNLVGEGYIPTDGNGMVKFENLQQDTTYYLVAKTETNKSSGKIEIRTQGDYIPTYDYSDNSSPNQTPSITVPVKTSQNSVTITAKVEENKATVNELTIEDIKKVTSNLKDSTDIEIDLTTLNKKIDSVVLPNASMKKIVAVIADPSNKVEGFTAKLSTATVELDSVALNAIVNQAGDNSIQLNVDDVGTSRLNSIQMESIKSLDVHAGIEAYFTSNGQRIGDFKGGVATVKIPFVVPTGFNSAGFSVYYVADNGETIKYKSEYINNCLQFEVNHFSDFIIVYNKDDINKELDTDKEKDPNKNTETKTIKLDKTFRKLQLKATKSTKESNQLKWIEVKDADGYIVYGNQCNHNNKTYKMIKQKEIKNASTTSWTDKGLKKGTYYKYCVKAYKLVDGKKVFIAKSKVIHTTTTGGKYGNAKAVKVNDTATTLKVGKNFTIKAEQVKESKPIAMHTDFRFESTNTKVATVSSKGVIKAKKAGTCYIYVYAQNGIFNKVKVTIK